jgi:hypothetical protein
VDVGREIQEVGMCPGCAKREGESGERGRENEKVEKEEDSSG